MNRLGRCCALLAAIAVAGCTAARHAPAPAPPPPPASPLTGITATAPDHSVVMRELFIAAGSYRAGASAAVSAQLWNNTGGTISLTGATVPLGGPVVLTGAGTPGAAFAVPVPGGGHVALNPAAAPYLEIRCLPGELRTGEALAMTFTFSNGARIAADVPVGPVAGTARTALATTTAAAGCTPR